MAVVAVLLVLVLHAQQWLGLRRQRQLLLVAVLRVVVGGERGRAEGEAGARQGERWGRQLRAAVACVGKGL
jgi:hypothetical protein